VAFGTNFSEVQRRVSSSCGAGEMMRGVHGNGSVTCAVDRDSGGDITSVGAGHGLIGGGVAGAVSMSVNLSAMQARIQGACATGMVVQSVGRDGSLVCVADANAGGDVTGVATGWGMVGGGVSGELTLAANRSEVQQRVSGMCPVGTFVRAVGLNGSVFCSEATEAQTRVAGVCPEGQSVQRVLANGNVACIDIGITATAAFSLTTGFGLTSVGGSGSLNFGVNTSAIQARIVDACAVGSFIRSIGREGELVCGVANSGDVTAVQTAGGLVGGGVSGDLTLAANTSFLQRRVHEACAAGSSMRAVHMNGSIDCEDDAGVRQVNTGTGVWGGGGGGRRDGCTDTLHRLDRCTTASRGHVRRRQQHS